MSMSLQRNRMHAVLDEMGRHLESRLGRRVFKIDTLLADPLRVAKVVAGSVDDSRRAILSAMGTMFPPRRELARERFDVLVYGVPDDSPYAVFSVYPLKRLSRIGRVIVVGPRDPAVPRHLGFEVAASVEEALARAETIHGRDCAIAHVRQPAPARPE